MHPPWPGPVKGGGVEVLGGHLHVDNAVRGRRIRRKTQRPDTVRVLDTPVVVKVEDGAIVRVTHQANLVEDLFEVAPHRVPEVVALVQYPRANERDLRDTVGRRRLPEPERDVWARAGCVKCQAVLWPCARARTAETRARTHCTASYTRLHAPRVPGPLGALPGSRLCMEARGVGAPRASASARMLSVALMLSVDSCPKYQPRT